MASGPFTLARLAKAAGMSVDDVQFYRDCDLLQPPRRHRQRSERLSFFSEHLERLKFINRARACGFTHEDIAAFIDTSGLVTCGDVYTIASHRLNAMQADGKAATREASCLAQLRSACGGVGSRQDCKIIEALSGPGH